MSWQDYVDTQLVATGQVSQAALLGVSDAGVWASTPDFMPRGYDATVTAEDGSESTVTVNEASDIVNFMATGTKPTAGLRINGDKYMVLRTLPDPMTVYGKKPKGGICITKTAQCIIVGVYDEDAGQTSGGCNLAVENLGDYLRNAGF